MKHTDILREYNHNVINLEDALDQMASIGMCPAILNDDDGRWAVTCDGVQNIVMGDEAEDIHTTFFAEAKLWKPTVREALIYFLETFD